MGQRLVLNLRRFREVSDSTRDLSLAVDRQMAAMPFGDSVEQADPSPRSNSIFELNLLGGEQAAE